MVKKLTLGHRTINLVSGGVFVSESKHLSTTIEIRVELVKHGIGRYRKDGRI